MKFGWTHEQYEQWLKGHWWFAWYPVIIENGQWCWMQRVWRVYTVNSPIMFLHGHFYSKNYYENKPE